MLSNEVFGKKNEFRGNNILTDYGFLTLKTI